MPIEMLPGDVLLERRNGLFGMALQLFVDKKYQHAACVWHDPSKVIEDWKNGVAVAVMHMEQPYREVWRPNCDDGIKKRSLDRMALRLGEPYGYQSVIAEGAWLDWGVTIPHGTSMYCSQLVCWGYAPEFPLLPGLDPAETPPWMLARSPHMTRVE